MRRDKLLALCTIRSYIHPMRLRPCAVCRRLLSVVMLFLSGSVWGAQSEISFLAPTNHVMPLAEFDGRTLRSGILKDLGDAIAERLGMHAKFILMPSKRVSEALRAGTADGVCYVLPGWIDGEFNWSNPVIPNLGIVIARSGTPEVQSIADLAGKPMGTVMGYRYPDFEQVLRQHFVREDAPTMALNLRKLVHGRMDYAITEQTTLAYHQRQAANPRLVQVLRFTSFTAQCAFSKQSKVPFPAIERAIDALVADGTVDNILARYR